MASRIRSSSRAALMRSFTPLKDSSATALLLSFEKSLDFDISLEAQLETGKLTRKLAAQEQFLFANIKQSLQRFLDNTKNEDYVWMLQNKYMETAAPHRPLYEDALDAIRGHSGQAFDTFVQEANDVAGRLLLVCKGDSFAFVVQYKICDLECTFF